MIEDIAKRITKSQSKNPWAYVLAFVVITLVLLPGLFQLVQNVEPSLEKVLPQSVPEVEAMNDMRTQFVADMMYILLETKPPLYDATTPDAIQYIDTLSARLQGYERIHEVRSIASITGVTEDQYQIDERLDHPATREYLSKDRQLTVLELRTDTGSDAKAIEETITVIKQEIYNMEPYNPGFHHEITGFNAIDRATFKIIMSDFARITAVAMALIMLLVYLTFRNLKRAVLPVVVVFVALLWTAGIAGYLAITITVVSMVSAAMILGLGIDFGIHTTHTYAEYKKKHSVDKAVSLTMQELLRALIAASLTTSAGFLALLFGVLPAMQNLGIILATGIISTLIGAVFLLPPILILTERRTRK